MTFQNAAFCSLVVPVRVEFVSDGARALYGDGLRPATSRSVGTDVRACFPEDCRELAPGERLTVPSGLRVQPEQPGVAGFLYSRSGLGARDGLVVAQGVGVIDPDYTGEILVVLLNTSAETRRIRRGERVAQLVFQPVVMPEWREAPLASTERGEGGFGHTGA
ncbi:MAG: dUTP diphosphatase [Desulfovibrio sp.]|uniref:dUTP diphosphatase n=1 Tax=Desulfovibrio sp. TaxID=885 RepID=UPI0025C0BC40|nr:dUTP diphosphatase [Desulfovibrio sp.]MCI7567822.1 dUTP diphosphatase [Desulfovibrio sp.]